MKRILIALTTGAILASSALAGIRTDAVQLAQAGGEDQALPQGFETTPVLKSGVDAANATIAYPETDTPEITSVVGTLEPGGRTALHQHPVPVYVYVLEGELVVRPEGGEPRTYRAGEAFIEQVNHTHQAFNEGTTPTRILVVFMGAQGQPTTVAVE